MTDKTPTSNDALQRRLKDLRDSGLELSLAEAHATHSQGQATFVDVREPSEVEQGAIPGAVLLPRGMLEIKAAQSLPDLGGEILLYCASGTRSLLAASSLKAMGYTNVRSVAGGYQAWVAARLPASRPALLSAEDRQRYQRHLAIPEVGEEGQLKLLEARVLLIGAGGLGSPAAYYLAAAGVGTLGIVDNDTVEASNLQRQILHTPDRIGQPKTLSAERTLKAFSPRTRLELYQERLTRDNVDRLFPKYDLVIDGSDNFVTRYLVNDAAVKHRKACIHGSIFRFDGHASVFDPARGGPCYRCLFPKPPPPEVAPSCAEAGVLGVLPGVIGLLEAVEAVKLILGKGEPLVGRLLTYDALAASFREFKVKQDPNCAYCAFARGERDFPGYVDYEEHCASR